MTGFPSGSDSAWSEAEQEELVAFLRAAEVGLLERHGGGTYGIHPALPWFFRDLFERFYAASREVALRAFVEAMRGLGNYYAA